MGSTEDTTVSDDHDRNDRSTPPWVESVDCDHARWDSSAAGPVTAHGEYEVPGE